MASMRASIGPDGHGAKRHAGTNALQDGNDMQALGDRRWPQADRGRVFWLPGNREQD